MRKERVVACARACYPFNLCYTFIMQKKAKKFIVLTIGIIFIILGFVGLALPFLQGIIFLIIGFLLVSFCSPKFRLWVNKNTERYPHLVAMINKIEKWIGKIVGEV